MPPIKSISFEDGIKIDCEGLPSIWLKRVDFPKKLPADTLQMLSQKVTKVLQDQYEERFLASSLDSEYHAGLTQLLPNERIEKVGNKDYLVITRMFVKVIVYSFDPLTYNIRCSDSPISADEVF